MITKPDAYLFSTCNESRTRSENMTAHEKTVTLLNSIDAPFSVVIGHYQGREELSFLIVGKKYQNLVETICKNHAQECYLHIHNDNHSELVYGDGKIEKVGKLTNVSKAEAEQLKNYTYVPVTGLYWTTK